MTVKKPDGNANLKPEQIDLIAAFDYKLKDEVKLEMETLAHA